MEHLKHLNDQQMRAVLQLDGPVLVLAGAGSGKTRVVTSRIIQLIQAGVSPYQILGLTFTNKAAEEMKERIHRALSHLDRKVPIWISTFHSLGARILRESIDCLGYPKDFAIYDEDDSEKLISLSLEKFGIKGAKGEIKALKNLISKAKNALLLANEVENDHLKDELRDLFPKIYEYYTEQLKVCQAVDFDDLLYLPVKLFQEHPERLAYYQQRWTHLLIDEYQDTNEAQYAFVKLLVEKSKNIFVVGDPDQSIYSWRGANIRNIMQFEKDYPGAQVIRLEQNYRSKTNILQAANALINRNSNRYDKNLWSERGEGQKIARFTGYNERDEARFVTMRLLNHHKHQIPYKEMVIFYRTNAQSRPFEDQFLSSGIPYTIVGGLSFYQRKEIKDLIAYLRLIISDSDQLAFTRAIQAPKRGLGQASIDKLIYGAQEANLPILVFAHGALEKGLISSSKAKKGLQDFLELITEIREFQKNSSLQDILTELVEKSNYLNYLREEPDTFEDRRANIAELIAKAVEWDVSKDNPPLSDFLEEISLKSSLDENAATDDRVSLMTVHNGKGLEFTVTFVVGLEEDLFPHANSRDNADQLEEERRLCYVGITRAKDFLYLTDCQMRYLWGSQRFQRPSRFLREIPGHYFKIESGFS